MSEAGKIKRTVGWQYRDLGVREDVELELPVGYKLYVWEVTSGDSGKKYWVQILNFESFKRPITMCSCNQGTFQQPLSILGLKICCKHAENLLLYLKEKGAQ
jgi:hypothetical protein